jgi:hypothetical protein
MKILAILVMLSLTLAACSKPQAPQAKDAALQTALDELTRLDSYTKTGVDFAAYSDRVLTASGNIDAALRRSSDVDANAKIKIALVYYVSARDTWKEYLDKGNPLMPSLVQEFWAKGANAIREAEQYFSADEATRRKIDADDEKKQQQDFEREPETTEKINPAVDSIHGFGSFILGAPSSDYSSRVEMPPEDPLLPKDPMGGITARVVQYQDNEREWATFPVQEVELDFEQGLVSAVRVKVAPELGFFHAFEIKYGPPTSSSDFSFSKTWEGNDTEVEMDLSPPSEYWNVIITSKKVHTLVADRTNTRFQREGDAIEKRAREAAPHFSDATPIASETPKKARRLAPEGIVYNVVRLSVRIKGGLAGIEPGTELKIISKNADGSLHVQTGNLAADVPASAVTNDLDVVAAVRSHQ